MDAAFSAGAGAGAGAGMGGMGDGAGDGARVPLGMKYICGDCGAVTYIKAHDYIRCRDCGHRILYKARTKRLVQVEAR